MATSPITPRYRDPNWHYVPARATDIRETFERERRRIGINPASPTVQAHRDWLREWAGRNKEHA